MNIVKSILVGVMFMMCVSAQAQYYTFEYKDNTYTLYVTGQLTIHPGENQKINYNYLDQAVMVGYETNIYYDSYGRVIAIGNISIVYGMSGKATTIGCMRIMYDSWDRVMETIGTILCL